MPQYLVVGQHPPDLCPAANETVRTLALEGRHRRCPPRPRS